MVSFATTNPHARDHRDHDGPLSIGERVNRAAVEDEMERILRCAGIESAPIDPSSMDALRDIVIDRRLHPKKEKEGNDLDNNKDNDNMKMPPQQSTASAASVVASVAASPRFVSTMSSSAAAAATTTSSAVARKPPSAMKKKACDEHHHHHHNNEDLHVSFSNNSDGDDDDDDDDKKLPSFTSTNSHALMATASAASTTNHKMVAKKFEDKAPSPVDRSMMDQLEFQTNLLIDMQRRIEELHAKVERLEGQQYQQQQPYSATRSYTFSKSTRVYRAGTESQQTSSTQPAFPADSATGTTTTTPTVRGGGNNDELQQQMAAAVADVELEGNQNNIQEEQEFWLVSLLFYPYRTIMNTKVMEIIKLYWTLSSEFGVRPFDGGLLFKLMFVVLVFSARLSRVKDRSNVKFANTSYTTGDVRFYFSIMVMVLGFLYHTKYLQYTYQFVYQDNIPLRVLNGENVQHLGPPPPAPPHPPVEPNNEDGNNNNNRFPDRGGGGNNNDNLPPNNVNRRGGLGQVQGLVGNNNNNNNANENNNNGWRNTFLAGEIQPVQDEQNPIIAGIQDAVYLVGSFFFSIFPMWHPEEPPQPPPPEQEEEQADDDYQNDIVDENEGHADNQIPPVQPPRNAMEPAEDDE